MPLKPLSELALAELWALFPISLVPYRPEWPPMADAEIHLLHGLLSPFSPRIHHIGSTAVPGLTAKPIIDILVELPPEAPSPDITTLLERHGYICMTQSSSRLSFNKGYTPAGYAPEVFHIHVHRFGDNNEIIFRDYLRTHPEAARRYEALKLSLLARFRSDRDAYTAAKTPFVSSILALVEGSNLH